MAIILYKNQYYVNYIVIFLLHYTRHAHIHCTYKMYIYNVHTHAHTNTPHVQKYCTHMYINPHKPIIYNIYCSLCRKMINEYKLQYHHRYKPQLQRPPVQQYYSNEEHYWLLMKCEFALPKCTYHIVQSLLFEVDQNSVRLFYVWCCLIIYVINIIYM